MDVLEKYSSAMDCWNGRVDSSEDYDAFRWHQWVKEIDLNNKPFNKFDGTLGFCFIGFCSDKGVKRNKGREGTALAPDFIRRQMSGLPCAFLQEVKLFDAGNINCDDITLEEGQKLLGLAVKEILDMGLFPIVLGGGHETTFGHYQGELAHAEDIVEKPDLAVVNFDAHFDMRPYDNGSTSGSMFLQIADVCREKGLKYGYLPIGIQRHSNTVSLFKSARAHGVDYITAKEIQDGSLAGILERVDTFLYRHKRAYMTICTDVFSSAFAPGVSATQSLGLDPENMLPIMKHILRTRKIVGFDICEISPRFDQDNTTANLGAVLVFSVVTTLAKLYNLDIELK